jgi:hypothetical protein
MPLRRGSGGEIEQRQSAFVVEAPLKFARRFIDYDFEGRPRRRSNQVPAEGRSVSFADYHMGMEGGRAVLEREVP